MSFKHRGHYHDSATSARECEFPTLCAHGMDAANCFGDQHYMYDEDEQTFGGRVNTGPVFPYKALTEQQKWEAGEPVMTHFQGSLRTSDGMYVRAGHETPCRCTVYDKCHQQRQADYQWSGNWRDRDRAYND